MSGKVAVLRMSTSRIVRLWVGLVILATWTTTLAQDNSVCTVQPSMSPDVVQKDIPDLPESFSMRVEANLLLKKKTTTLHEYYNFDANIAAVRQMEDGEEAMFFYQYNSNQLLSLMPDSNGGYICTSQDLSQSDNREMFGLKKTNSTTDRIYSVLGALHFAGGVPEKWKGKNIVRGIPCDLWESCQYWPELNATATVQWYFVDLKYPWTTVSDYAAPVRCHVEGKRWLNATYFYPFEHIYEFYDFQASLSAADSHFEVPRNTYCYSEINTKPIPQMPPAYSFDAELLDVTAKTIGFIREEYDNKTKLMKYSYREAPDASSPFGTRYITQIHDYSTGVNYQIDVLHQTCSVSILTEHSFDDVNVDASHVRLKNPNEFMDLTYNYVYQGVHTVRGIDCDSWAAMRTDYPSVGADNNPVTTWTMYFATKSWMEAMGFRNNYVMPVMMEIFSDSSPHNNIHKQLSFYEYNAESPDPLTYDLSSCYSATDSRVYSFLVPGQFQNIVAGDLKNFKYMVLLSLIAVLSVSPLRISQMDAQEAGSYVLVTFTLLDKAPITGDVVNVVHEPTLAEAYQVLDSAVTSGKMQIILSNADFSTMNKVTVKPAGPEYQLQNSYDPGSDPASPQNGNNVGSDVPSNPPSSGFSAGAMGGMGIGMLVLGALLGFGAMYLVYRSKGGTFGSSAINMTRFDNEKDEPDDTT